jgi:hypothetical protein
MRDNRGQLGSHQSQKMSYEEGLAIGALQELGEPDPPIDAFDLADRLGLRVELADIAEARLVGDVIQVNRYLRRERKHGKVAHELGHYLIKRDAKLVDSEWSASFVAGSLLLPRTEFVRDLRETHWDVGALRAKHINCSAELIAKRIVSVRNAAVTIWDNGKLKERVISPELPKGYKRLSKFERELAARVLASGESEQAGNLQWGFAIFSGAWKRVITVCEAEQLALRYYDSSASDAKASPRHRSRPSRGRSGSW